MFFKKWSKNIFGSFEFLNKSFLKIGIIIFFPNSYKDLEKLVQFHLTKCEYKSQMTGMFSFMYFFKISNDWNV